MAKDLTSVLYASFDVVSLLSGFDVESGSGGAKRRHT